MRVLAGVCVCGLKAATGAFLCFVAASGGAMAQDTGQSQVENPQDGPPTLGKPAAPPAQPTWVVNCMSTQAGFDCSASQAFFVKETGQRLLSMAVRVPPNNDPDLLLLLPLGIYLPAGVSLQFGKEEAVKKIAIQSCDKNGCRAEYDISNGEIAAMLKGADLTISFQNLEKDPLIIQLPVLGFPAAYAKIK